MKKNVLIISNGHGEDLIASNLAKELIKHNRIYNLSVIPLVGKGYAFKEINIDPNLTNPSFPSGGFIRNIEDLYKDIMSGLVSHIMKQRKYIKQLGDKSNICIAVGDVYCLWMAKAAKIKEVYFLPTAKSDTFMKHSLIEQWLIKKVALKSYPRDQITTNTFQKLGLTAEFYGNVMMDNLVTDRKVISLTQKEYLVGILPGSREEAYQNLAYCLKIADRLGKELKNIKFCLAISKTLDIDKVKKYSGWSTKKISNKTSVVELNYNSNVLLTEDFLAVINQSNVIIGLAGTANEQAAFLGKPVICFEGFGTQSTMQRFQEQQKLMGKNIILCKKREIPLIVDQVKIHLKVSKNSIKNQSISKKIIKNILS
tara:strand:+ start:1267 stop:2373 length:1107 start_codon:yes stop_codon:yes gene_type:complete